MNQITFKCECGHLIAYFFPEHLARNLLLPPLILLISAVFHGGKFAIYSSIELKTVLLSSIGCPPDLNLYILGRVVRPS